MNQCPQEGSLSLEQDNLILKQIIQSSSDGKGIDPIILDVSKLIDITDKFVIISGRSDRHVLGITNRILADLGKYKVKPISQEGMNKAHWVLLDFDTIVVHIFYQPTRELYDLESLWNKAPQISIESILSKEAA